MRLFNFIILFFLLSAFAVGIALENNGGDKFLIDSAINNASLAIENITLTNSQNYTNIPNADGFFLVIEKYIKFIGSLAFETMRAGIHFGYDNPHYFSPEFIILIMKIMVFALIVSLLIKPIGYLIIFLVMFIMMIVDKVKKRKKKKVKDGKK